MSHIDYYLFILTKPAASNQVRPPWGSPTSRSARRRLEMPPMFPMGVKGPPRIPWSRDFDYV